MGVCFGEPFALNHYKDANPTRPTLLCPTSQKYAFSRYNEPAHASFLSAANRKLRCNCLLQLALTDVRYWHKADIPSCTAHVRFRG